MELPGGGENPGVIFGIGHSTLSAAAFMELLASAPATALWDIRSYPTSRWPWFAGEELARRLPPAGIDYRWVKALGGRRRAPRHPAPDAAPPADPVTTSRTSRAADLALPVDSAIALFSPPVGGAPRWTAEGFENYQWHMATPEFLAAASELLIAGRRVDVAIMCAEALWWRCHRSMVADFVVYAGGEVIHLQPERRAHSAVIGDRFARYDPGVLAVWERHLAGLRDPG